jgi:hypothetical protein
MEVGEIMGRSGYVYGTRQHTSMGHISVYETCQRIRYVQMGSTGFLGYPDRTQTGSVRHQPKGYRAISAVHVFPAETFRKKEAY